MTQENVELCLKMLRESGMVDNANTNTLVELVREVVQYKLKVKKVLSNLLNNVTVTGERDEDTYDKTVQRYDEAICDGAEALNISLYDREKETI